MINSIVVCENITEDFKPINIKKNFFSNDFSIQILVKMDLIKQDTNIYFHWYISNNEKLIATYEIPLKANEEKIRYAVGGVEIGRLILEKNFNPLQKWFVLVELNDQTEKIEFEIKPFKTDGFSNQVSNHSRYSWQA
ncbi:hypothetical protein [Gottfriedia luciferensis]|uniref:hypothetical protein n=1 Tax=Gottfriedia luciferensis TaxID=178774 RepID=UPI000B440FAE|nr:hypothetical protein [Gottfriedia luciferensis]